MLFADDRVLVAWHERGDSVEATAKELNERYRRGYNDKESTRQLREEMKLIESTISIFAPTE